MATTQIKDVKQKRILAITTPHTKGLSIQFLTSFFFFGLSHWSSRFAPIQNYQLSIQHLDWVSRGNLGTPLGQNDYLL
ncbi:MAG: hypothetical protein QNJ55_28125, partial [Xenococcus sp. MO_188.B8]|nr:hypothetical protein [Xenococcus sp. MO_188.B8]